MPLKAKNRSVHVPHMDLLRAIAITCVFVSHLLHNAFPGREFQFRGLLGYQESPLQTYLTFLLGPGHLGVVLFFLISGFCIRLSTCAECSLHYRKFMWKRLWRIAPPYWLCLGMLIFWSYNKPESGYDTTDWMLHTVFLHNFSASAFKSINGPFWSIALEVQTYAVFPLLLFLLGRMGKVRTGALLAALAFVSTFAARPSVQAMLHMQVVCSFLGRSPLTLWFAWYLGLILADDYSRGAFKRWNSWGLVILTLAIFPMVRMVAVFAPLSEIYNSLLVYLIAERLLHSPLPDHFLIRMLGLIGIVSYSVYLWFDPLLWSVSQWCLSYGINGFSLVAIGIFAVFPSVIAFAWILYKCVEIPSIRCGRMLSGRIFSIVSPSA